MIQCRQVEQAYYESFVRRSSSDWPRTFVGQRHQAQPFPVSVRITQNERVETSNPTSRGRQGTDKALVLPRCDPSTDGFPFQFHEACRVAFKIKAQEGRIEKKTRLKNRAPLRHEKLLPQTYHRFSKSVKPVPENRGFPRSIGLPQSERSIAVGRITESTDSGHFAEPAFSRRIGQRRITDHNNDHPLHRPDFSRTRHRPASRIAHKTSQHYCETQ